MSDMEDNDDAKSFASDVSYEIIETASCTDRLGGLIIRLVVSSLFIGACAGALIWSFEEGEAGINVGPNYRDASVNFSIFVDEYTQSMGSYSVTYRQPDSPKNVLTKPVSYPSYWIQDNKNQRLVHKRDNMTTVYAFSNHAFHAINDESGAIVDCRFEARHNYSSYISRLGLAHLTREHSEYETTYNHAKVFIYNGDPNTVILEQTPQHAFLVTSYADAHTGALLGWNTYFTASNSSLVYLISYWYDTMVPSMPDPNSFNPPASCQPK